MKPTCANCKFYSPPQHDNDISCAINPSGQACNCLDYTPIIAENSLEQAQMTIKQIEAEIDNEIAFDATLRNDAQRKAKRQQLLDEHPQYWEQQEILSLNKGKRESTFIELCLRRNEFSVLKLEKREAIARLELQANS